MPPSIAWIGGCHGDELSWARRGVADLAVVHAFDRPAEACVAPTGPPWPAVVFVASDGSARWPLADLVAVSRRWPLAPLVSVATSLVDGRRRSGPALPVTDEVPWSELPARLACWLASRAMGRPGTLGLPVTARREDRAVEALASLHPGPDGGPRVSVAAERRIDLDGLADLLAATGRDVCRRTCGRPPLDDTADLLVWDTSALDAPHLAWLRLLVANRPGLRVVIVDSFPRTDTALAALRAGAVAVLGRPLAPESLAGVLSGPPAPPANGLGRPGAAG